MAPMINFGINKKYAKQFDIADITFCEALRGGGYEETVMSLLAGRPQLFRKTKNDYYFLLNKWLKDLLNNDASLLDLGVYLNPIVTVN